MSADPAPIRPERRHAPVRQTAAPGNWVSHLGARAMAHLGKHSGTQAEHNALIACWQIGKPIDAAATGQTKTSTDLVVQACQRVHIQGMHSVM